MAEYVTGIAAGPGALYNFLVALKDQMVLNGWTLLHTINATPGTYEIVLKSAALDATADNRAFIRIKQTSIIAFHILCYQDWDTGAIAGINEGGASSSSYHNAADGSFGYFIKTNGLAVAWCNKDGTSYRKNHFGLLRRGLGSKKNGMTKTTGAVIIGATSLPVASNMTGKLQVGQKIHIFNYAHDNVSANKANAEVVEVASVAAGAIGITATTKAYDTGALVGQNPLPVMVAVQSTGSLPFSTTYHPTHLDGSYVGATIHNGAPTAVLLGYELSTDPDDNILEYSGGLWTVASSTASKTGHRGFAYHWEACSGGGQAPEDLMDDGEYTYMLLGIDSTQACILGPREV